MASAANSGKPRIQWWRRGELSQATRLMANMEGRNGFSYVELYAARCRAFRNGNWCKLELPERALFNATMALARIRGRIINRSLVDRIAGIVFRMLETISSTLLRRGIKKAAWLEGLYSRNGVFAWLPKMRSLLQDPGYLTWLGLSTINFEAV